MTVLKGLSAFKLV